MLNWIYFSKREGGPALLPLLSGYTLRCMIAMNDVTRKITGLLVSEPTLSLPEQYQPVIGLPISVSTSKQGPLLSVDAVGAWAVERLGGSVLLLPIWPVPPSQQIFQTLWPLVRYLDGILLPARNEYANDSCWYEPWLSPTSTPTAVVSTMRWEMGLIQLATFLGVPILGIGDGAEKWSVALGGSMYMPTTKKWNKWIGRSPRPERWPHQVLNIRKHSKLAEVLELDRQESHDARWSIPYTSQLEVEHLAAGLRASARLENMQTAAFERIDGAFGAGFLGRIDWALDQSAPLFEAFVNAGRNYAAVRRQGEWETLRDNVCSSILNLVSAKLPLLTPPSPPKEKARYAAPTAFRDNLPGDMENISYPRTLAKRPHAPTVQQIREYKRLLLHRQQNVNASLRSTQKLPETVGKW
jgi:gamma-glutamyl-gamma-aminobutyrate hydrolase PuuD